MIITVHLHTILGRPTADGLMRNLELELPADSTVGELLIDLDLDFPIDQLLLVVNGRLGSIEDNLTDGDKVNLMPAISGG